MFACCIRLSRHLPGNFCCGALLCWHLKPFLDVTLLCFRDLPVPAMSGVGNLWVLYCLTSCQIVSWLHGDWSGGSEFWIKCRRWSEEALQCLMRIWTVCLFCLISHLNPPVCSVLQPALLAHRDCLGYQGWRWGMTVFLGTYDSFSLLWSILIWPWVY